MFVIVIVCNCILVYIDIYIYIYTFSKLRENPIKFFFFKNPKLKLFIMEGCLSQPRIQL